MFHLVPRSTISLYFLVILSNVFTQFPLSTLPRVPVTVELKRDNSAAYTLSSYWLFILICDGVKIVSKVELFRTHKGDPYYIHSSFLSLAHCTYTVTLVKMISRCNLGFLRLMLC